MAAIDWKSWREKNKYRLVIAEKDRQKNPERKAYMRKYLKEYYQRNREKLIASVSAFYQSNKPAKRKYGQVYREKNAEKIRSRRQREYYSDLNATHLRSRAYSRARYKEKKDHIKAKQKAWRDKNRVRVRAQTNARWHKRRALEKLAAKNLEQLKSYVQETRLKSNFTCYYCEGKFPISKLHFDHIVPLSKGGSHSVDNLCTSCESCNCSKGPKLLVDWSKEGQQILTL